MTRVFASDGFFGHGHTSKIVIINSCRSRRGDDEIAEDFSKVNDFLSALTSGHIFNFRGGKRDTIPSARFPGHSATAKHEDIAGV